MMLHIIASRIHFAALTAFLHDTQVWHIANLHYTLPA
jgi:hypothetical protein